MAISINSNFKIGSPEPLDTRTVLSNEEMLTIDDAVMPSVYYALNSDDGQLYIYNKDNEMDVDTGKFRVVEGGGGDLSNYLSYTSEAFDIISTHTFEPTEYTETEVDAMFNESAEELEELSKIIADNLKSKFKLWSSQKTADEIAQAILEANKYTEDMLGEKASISLEVVTSLPATGEGTVIYILQSGGQNTLNVYSKDTWVEVGNLDSVDFSDYYNKTKVDELLEVKADLDTVVKYDDIVQNLDNPDGATTLSTFGLNKEINRINESLEGKINTTKNGLDYTNMNDILEVGSFYFRAQQIENAPADAYEDEGKLDATLEVVLLSEKNNAYIQTLRVAKGGQMFVYTRRIFDGRWSAWQELATMDKVKALDSFAIKAFNQTQTDILAYALTCDMNKRSMIRIHSINAINNPFGVTSDTDFIYTVDKIDDKNSWISIQAKDVRTNRMFVNTKNDVQWLGWREI